MRLAAQTATTLICAGCGHVLPPEDPYPFRCPNGGTDDVDHVLRRKLDIGAHRAEAFEDREADPFIRFRRFTHAWHTAIARGMSDGQFIAIVQDLERRIGQAFHETPLYEEHTLARALDLHGNLWIKNETRGVAGSSKARHLMGIAIWLSVMDIDSRRRLAFAGGGNAAIAAAIIARALSRPLDVYLSADSDPSIIAKLYTLGATVIRCERRANAPGNPELARFRDAVAHGALPFTPQGTENALAIEGGATLGWELIAQMRSSSLTLDRLFIQTGGGSLAAAIISAFEDAEIPLPKIHAVQTTSGAPLKRAFDRIQALGFTLGQAIHHRMEFMSPETPGESIAAGILEDETYDWAAIMRGMLNSNGSPVVVSEELLARANRIANATTGIRVTPTGTAGLAGLMELQRRGEIAPNESACVVLTS